jgi:phytanoyl-CoA dioxygenase PhyH
MSTSQEATLRDAVTRPGAGHADMLACLRENGICVVPGFFSPDFIDPIREACKARMAEEGDRNYDDGSYKRSDAYRGTAAASNERIYHADCFTDAGKFRHHPVLKQVASDYYGSPHSVHLCLYERHRPNEIPPGGFHVDTFELSTFKIMLYLNDVTEKDGPTSYLIGTHKDADLRYQKEHVWGGAVSPGDPSGRKHPTTFTDEELGPRLEKHVKVVGPRGTIILFDTWGVHKGIPPQPGGERHILVNYYRKGADLPRSDFGFDAQADYKRYHIDYKKHKPA